MRRHKRKSNLKPVLKIFFITILIGGSLIVLYKLLINWEEFKIKQITVTGTSRVEKSQIRKYFKDRYLLKLDINKIKGKIEKLKPVKKVAIKRELPDKIEVAVTERMAIAIIRKNNKIFLIDEDGKFFDKTKKENYPLIKNRDYLDKKLELLKKYKNLQKNKYNLLEKIIMLNEYDIGMIFKLNNNSRLTLNIGRNQFGQKLFLINKVFSQIKQNTYKIDMRFLPYVIYKDGGG